MGERILDVKNLKINFHTYAGDVKAIRDVSFHLDKGETLAIVGESGSGKSVTTKSLMGLLANNAEVVGGSIMYRGEDLLKKTEKEMQEIRGKDIAMIFQDPMACLNPRQKVADIIAQGLDIHHRYHSQKERTEMVADILHKVGLAPEHANRYPHQFSGGQRQRVGIARALVMNPKLIIADECISALDMSIQAQVVNMFEELQEKLGVAYLFIAHDLLVVHHISDRIAVMYLGKMMEIADADELNANPIHPYTLSLLSAVPIPDPETARKSHRIVLEGDVPSPLKMPTGCPFRTRCKYATEKCGQEMPQLTDRGNGHMVACWNK